VLALIAAAPGHTSRSLAEELQLSRAHVRGVLRRLTAGGLVTRALAGGGEYAYAAVERPAREPA